MQDMLRFLQSYDPNDRLARILNANGNVLLSILNVFEAYKTPSSIEPTQFRSTNIPTLEIEQNVTLQALWLLSFIISSPSYCLVVLMVIMTFCFCTTRNIIKEPMVCANCQCFWIDSVATWMWIARTYFAQTLNERGMRHLIKKSWTVEWLDFSLTTVSCLASLKIRDVTRQAFQ